MSNLKNLKETIDKMITDAGNNWESVPIAYSLWVGEDVRSLAPDFSDDEVRLVLEEVYDSQDCSIGMNWATIECAIEEVKRGRNGITH